MIVPSDLTGKELLKLCSRHFGYEKTRQVGSHIRATTTINGQHHITIPDHKPIKTNTLRGIVKDIAEHFGKDPKYISEVLFG
ncbi:type II toxin-antitoxin system HicA family toxin [Dyadobacter sp. CY312]|uniref:type II toxin-antitoxin system HicA family toxin n=1 Tax=Dyadobacter sp. CY312 TaxID=2907303 RepID=UPI001F3542E5|nr:type II toxin-antitoxin system HicA family toxin [Dyadobacter sp. CY312]MCE7042106.1 type II toxin-antitoxin system HicA family toxin [Dyadobacter sp. CY312]